MDNTLLYSDEGYYHNILIKRYYVRFNGHILTLIYTPHERHCATLLGQACGQTAAERNERMPQLCNYIRGLIGGDPKAISMQLVV